MNAVQIWVTIASLFIIYATVELIRKLLKKEEPLWKILKRWFINIFDTLSGGW